MQPQSLTDQQRLNRAEPNNIGPDDPRYLELTRRGFNKRFDAKPDYVRLVGSTADVIDAVQAAVRAGLRLAVRSGGHCLEGFVADPAVRVIIDTSPMSSVGYDPEMDAFVIEAGTTLGDVYRRLFLGWGVVLPAGQSPDVGIGGHALGGAFGFLHRQHGLAVDYLYAVEVVVVGEDGTARSVIATSDPSDPNRELWWAHTVAVVETLASSRGIGFRALPESSGLGRHAKSRMGMEGCRRAGVYNNSYATTRSGVNATAAKRRLMRRSSACSPRGVASFPVRSSSEPCRPPASRPKLSSTSTWPRLAGVGVSAHATR